MNPVEITSLFIHRKYNKDFSKSLYDTKKSFQLMITIAASCTKLEFREIRDDGESKLSKLFHSFSYRHDVEETSTSSSQARFYRQTNDLQTVSFSSFLSLQSFRQACRA